MQICISQWSPPFLLVISLISAVNPSFSSLQLSRFQPLARREACAVNMPKKERRDGVVKEKLLHRPQGHTEQRRRLHILLLEARYPLRCWRGKRKRIGKPAKLRQLRVDQREHMHRVHLEVGTVSKRSSLVGVRDNLALLWKETAEVREDYK